MLSVDYRCAFWGSKREKPGGFCRVFGRWTAGAEAHLFWRGQDACATGIIEQLNRDVNAALADPKMKAHIADLGGVVFPGSTTEFANLIAKETVKWVKVIRAANIKVE